MLKREAVAEICTGRNVEVVVAGADWIYRFFGDEFEGTSS